MKRNEFCKKSKFLLLKSVAGRLVVAAFVFVFAACFCGCTTEIKAQLIGNQTVKIEFSASTTTASNLFSEPLDEKQVAFELAKSGFSSVNVKNAAAGKVSITLEDKNASSVLFTCGLLEIKNGGLQLNLSRQNLQKFYAAADEQTVAILDLFLAPVFNDEEMSRSEYEDLLNTVYGQSTASEITQCILKIKLQNAAGQQEEVRIPLVELLL